MDTLLIPFNAGKLNQLLSKTTLESNEDLVCTAFELLSFVCDTISKDDGKILCTYNPETNVFGEIELPWIKIKDKIIH